MRARKTILILCAGIAINASAQTFTQRIQKPTAGQTGKNASIPAKEGTVTVTQSAEIDNLVNSAELTAKTVSDTSPTKQPATSSTKTTNKDNKPGTTATTSSNSPTAEQQEPDMSKKVMRGGTRVNGYRVQAFAGGNSRKDRQKAENVAASIKTHYPNTPVYVHFHSPRWICRVGNYRTYEEAHQMLVSMKSLGFKESTIVKSKITVSY